MSDETRNDHVGPDAQEPQGPKTPESWAEVPGTTPPAADAGARVAFCQDCGKPLTAETLRAVGTGVFCEPCLMARVAAQNGVPPCATVPPARYPGEPVLAHGSPVLAGFLGIIPGVGAMYNGQYAKGFAHLIIFVLLDSISKNVGDAFGLFVFAWVCYQIFDAYHTAKARNEGLPLPNLFGLNDIGEKMGFGRTSGVPTQGAQPNRPPTPQTPPAAWSPGSGSTGSSSSGPVPGGPVSAGPDWVGYVPPTNFAASAAQQAEAHAATAVHHAYRDAGFAPPHVETFTGATANNPYAVPPVSDWSAAQTMPVEVLVGRKRFPVGAIWLIGLGLVILLANLVPNWKLTERWWPPVLFAGLSALIFARRIRSGAPIITILRAPIVLMVLAVMFALHAADVYVNFGILFAILFITIGLLLVLERTLAHTQAYVAAEAPSASFVPGPNHNATPPPVPAPVPQDDAMNGGIL